MGERRTERQGGFRRYLDSFVNDEESNEEEPEPCLLTDEGYFKLAFEVWYRTNFQVWPRPGGLDNQDPQWIEDALRCLRYINAQRRKQKKYDDLPSPVKEYMAMREKAASSDTV